MPEDECQNVKTPQEAGAQQHRPESQSMWMRVVVFLQRCQHGECDSSCCSGNYRFFAIRYTQVGARSCVIDTIEVTIESTECKQCRADEACIEYSNLRWPDRCGSHHSRERDQVDHADTDIRRIGVRGKFLAKVLSECEDSGADDQDPERYKNHDSSRWPCILISKFCVSQMVKKVMYY